MNIPTIGGTRGIFEIFVPGVFLLLNIGGVLYLSPFIDQNTKDLLLSASSSPVLGLVIAICFGYLIGILLRLLPVDLADNLSAGWLRRFSRAATKGKKHETLFASEAFPYIEYMEETSRHYLLPEAAQFYKRVWAERKQTGQNKHFINFCKVLIASEDEHATFEIYAAEALTRYIAGMFYALIFAIVLILVVIVSSFATGQTPSGLIFILAAYFLAILEIIQNFRRIRVKEVGAIFAASFKNRSLFENEKTTAKSRVSKANVPRWIPRPGPRT